MSNTTTTPADNNGKQFVSITDLSGRALTQAVRMWASENGITVSDRGAVSPDVMMQAITSGATFDPALFETRTVYVLTTADGTAYKITGPKGKATLDGLAESVGLDPAQVANVTRDGALWTLPRRQAGQTVAPWTVTYRDGDGTASAEYTQTTRGRLSIEAVAVALKVRQTDILSVVRGADRYVPEWSARLVRVSE